MHGDGPLHSAGEAQVDIVDTIACGGTAPSYCEIAKPLRPAIHILGARQYVDQLVGEGYRERQLASRGRIAVRAVVRCRQAFENTLDSLGFANASPLCPLIQARSTLDSCRSFDRLSTSRRRIAISRCTSRCRSLAGALAAFATSSSPSSATSCRPARSTASARRICR